MTPIVCVGETLAGNEAGRTAEVVTRQVKGALAGLTDEHAAGLVVAYEPVWAIGTGKAATPGGANDVIGGMIRPALAELFSGAIAQAIRVQYGGSVTPPTPPSSLASPISTGRSSAAPA